MRRKTVLKYDEVMNEQRRVIYDQRNRILNGEDFGEQVREMIAEQIGVVVHTHLGGQQYAEEWDLDALFVGLRTLYDPGIRPAEIDIEAMTADEVAELLADDALARYEERETELGADQMRAVERAVMLQIIDSRWKETLLDMDYLQEGIHLRALGQRDPLVEYKSEGFELFQDMLEGIKSSTVTTLLKNSAQDLSYFAAMTFDEPVQIVNYSSGDELAYETSFADAARSGGDLSVYDGMDGTGTMNAGAGAQRFQEAQSAGGVAVQQRVVEQKIGRNDPCWCGSGKKFKKCHGA